MGLEGMAKILRKVNKTLTRAFFLCEYFYCDIHVEICLILD